MKLKIKKDALVEVIAGSDKGKKGTVLEVDSKNLRVKVQGVRVQTKNDKKEGQIKRESFIDYSNVKLLEAAKPKSKAAKKTKSAKK